jgi:F-type H+-transporting ATPase subunit delta
MSDRIEVWAQSLLEIAQAEGNLHEVEDELFRFARIVEGNDALRTALSNPGQSAERRASIVDDLLENRSLQTTRALAAFIVGAGRGHDLPAIVARFVELAAQSREHEVAEVRSAVPLDDDQVAKIGAALGRSLKKNIEVRVVVDPTLMGGIVATIGDTVIDGTVRHRLEQLKETL